MLTRSWFTICALVHKPIVINTVVKQAISAISETRLNLNLIYMPMERFWPKPMTSLHVCMMVLET